MRSKLIATVFVIAGAMLLFTPLAAAQDNPKAEKSKQDQQKAQKQKSQKQKAEKKVQKKTVRAKTTNSASNAALSILDAKIATEVKDREVVSPADTFNTGDKVTVWLSVKNPKEAGKVTLVFFRNDAEAGTVELDVGKSYRWRTWARRTVGSAGDWKVDVRDEAGTSLKTLEFTVN